MKQIAIRKHYTIEAWKIPYLVMLFAVFKPAYLPNSILIYVYYVAEALTLGYLVIATIGEKFTNYKLIAFLGLYYLLLLFSTIINLGSFTDWFEEVLTTFLVILWVHKATQRDAKSCLRMLMILFEFLIYMNLITVILYPEGLYRSADAIVSARYGWFLGHQSLFSMYAGPAICIAALYIQLNDSLFSKIQSIALISACVYQTAILGSANNIMCIVVIGAGTLIMSIMKMDKFPFKLFLVLLTIITVTIVILQATDFMEPFVTKYLHRSMTFTDRTYVWTRAWNIIKEHFLFGIGVQTDDTFKSLIGGAHAHDQYLQCMLEGGFPLLIAFLMIILQTFKNMKKFNHFLSGKIFTSALAALLVQMIFEVYFHHTMGKALIVLSYYLPCFYENASSRLKEN